MAAETIGEMQKRMDEASEKIGKAQAECEGKLTALKLKSNCMEFMMECRSNQKKPC